MGFGFFDQSVVGALPQNYTANSVSSSTSIVKYGNCTTDSLISRWSGIGVNLDFEGQARMVMISSTSEGTTTAAQLCPIFKALGITNALRLDGGPSAALAIDGQLVNRLTGLYRLKYGPSRHVAYALRTGQK